MTSIWSAWIAATQFAQLVSTGTMVTPRSLARALPRSMPTPLQVPDIGSLKNHGSPR